MSESYNTNNICLCKKVSEAKMVAAYEAGAKTVNRIKYKTGAGSGACKGRRCTPKIEALVTALKSAEKDAGEVGFQE